MTAAVPTPPGVYRAAPTAHPLITKTTVNQYICASHIPNTETAGR
jgi:hypothetical protein